VKILFVCTGNICRSPMAEGILKHKFQQLNYSGTVDSAGFESFHIGDSPDERAVITMNKRGIDITGHVARLFNVKDFDRFDQIYVMDSNHYMNVSLLARDDKDMEKVDYMMNVVHPGTDKPVQDPWDHDLSAFEKVYNELDLACGVLAKKIVSGSHLS
jgi:protein-tyrosine phosphatase